MRLGGEELGPTGRMDSVSRTEVRNSRAGNHGSIVQFSESNGTFFPVTVADHCADANNDVSDCSDKSATGGSVAVSWHLKNAPRSTESPRSSTALPATAVRWCSLAQPCLALADRARRSIRSLPTTLPANHSVKGRIAWVQRLRTVTEAFDGRQPLAPTSGGVTELAMLTPMTVPRRRFTCVGCGLQCGDHTSRGVFAEHVLYRWCEAA